MFKAGEVIILTKDVLFIGKGTPALVVKMSKPGRTVYAKLASGETFSCSIDHVVAASSPEASEIIKAEFRRLRNDITSLPEELRNELIDLGKKFLDEQKENGYSTYGYMYCVYPARVGAGTMTQEQQDLCLRYLENLLGEDLTSE